MMNCAAPGGTPPRRFNELKTPILDSQEPVHGFRSYLPHFSWLGVRTIPVHAVSIDFPGLPESPDFHVPGISIIATDFHK